MKKRVAYLCLALATSISPARAQNCTSFPYQPPAAIVNGMTADASQIMANYNYLGTCVAQAVAPLLTGPVGINTTTPAYPLDVAGFINTNQASGYNQAGALVLYSNPTNFTLAVGASSAGGWMNSLLSTDWYSVAVGNGALATSPGSNTGAIQNVAIGYDALQDNLSGYNNTALGFEALQDNAGGYQNVGLGNAALQSNTSGYNNTAVGSGALQTLTTGYRNTAVGQNALTNLTTGSANVALGFQAIYHGQTSTNGVMIGVSAGSGSAGYHNSGSTYVGYRAGYGVATGSDYNVFVGYEAGGGATTGNRNIILAEEDSTPDGITTGSGNILIGDNLAALSATGSNQLDIGNLIFGTGLTGSGSTISGNIGIGLTSPGYMLQVNGPVAGNGAYVNTSDARLKKDVVPITNAVAIIDQLQGVRFQWRALDERTVGRNLNLPTGNPQIGFIAQDLGKVLPEAVSTASGPEKIMSVAESKVVPILVEAIKELQAKNDRLALDVQRQSVLSANDRQELADLKNANDILLARLSDMDRRLSAVESRAVTRTAANNLPTVHSPKIGAQK
jgi:Chaperone of endosialidase